jgi:cellulose synthase/poly-beta-1,6-N-acetylglucosamine synthase-like glycosyltransferase
MEKDFNSQLSLKELMPKISILVPVYRESEFLEPLLKNLLSDSFKEREIFVIVDEPTEKSLSLGKKFMGKVYFLWNGERRGKVNVLNEVIEKSCGEVLLFLDSDVLIYEESGSFLKRIYDETIRADIVEVKKLIVRDSFLARIVAYDYLGFNLTSWFFSHRLGKCLGLNGAAFAIKRKTFIELGGFRKVIVEDLDIGTRSFFRGASYSFLEDIGIYTKAPSSWHVWLKQRKRWGIGGALWLKEYLRDLLGIVKKHPSLLLPSLFFLFPFLPFFLFTVFTPDELYMKIVYLSLLFFSTKTSLFLPPAAFTSTSLALMRSFMPLLGSLGTYFFIFYWAAKKMKCPFNPLEFIFYYLVYSPLWLLVMIASLIKIYTGLGEIEIDWKN